MPPVTTKHQFVHKPKTLDMLLSRTRTIMKHCLLMGLHNSDGKLKHRQSITLQSKAYAAVTWKLLFPRKGALNVFSSPSSSNYIIFKPRTRLEHFFFPPFIANVWLWTFSKWNSCRYKVWSSSATTWWQYTWKKETLLKQVRVVTRCMACSCDVLGAARDDPQTRSSLFSHAPPAVPRSLLLLHFSFDLRYIMVIFPMSHLHDGKCLVAKKKKKYF